jgi:ATP phosphoribosyltransferase regulatory subunit
VIERLRRSILDLFESHGYELVAPPMLEYLESLLSGTGSDLDIATFKLVDQLSGRMLGLRADHTPQVARIDAHLIDRQGVTRLCYCGSVLHTRPAGMTKMREPIQIGAELYGHAGLEADVEIVRLMVEALQRAGIERLHVDLGNPAIYRAMAAGGDPERAAEVFRAVQQKDAVGAGDLAILTTLNGGPEVIERARRELPAAVQPLLATLETLAQRCAAPGVEISFDLAELGGFNYESGLAFAAFAPGSPDAIARGGRYDEVGRSFGRARPATGFTMDLRQLARLSPSAVGEGRAGGGRILAPCSDDATLQELVRKLRSQGEVVVVALPGHDPAELGCTRRIEMKEGKWHVT